jgi:crotonobetainyl-CoA:carnitine CoA-transferase CaiB-like acyl-CoA transferase
MAPPLQHLRVVDCSRGTAGPRLTGLLADYGADVIWVEPPGGDPFRAELAVEYSVFNRGKRSVVLDLRDPDGRDRLIDLLATADVFVESWRPGVAERLGIGYGVLHARYPGLVYCSISGFGQDGPHRDVRGYEALVHAIVGTMGEQVGHREGPIFEGLPFASIGAAYLAGIGTLAALHRRGEDRIGRRIETSLLDGALAYLSMVWGDYDIGGTPHIAGGRRLVCRAFLCADGQYIGVHTGAVGAFGRLMKETALDDRIPPSEDGLDMGVDLTPDQQKLIEFDLVDIFASRPRAEWLQRLLAADICVVPNLHPGQVFDEPQTIHNRMVVRVDDPVLGPVDQVAPAARLSVTLHVIPRPAPTAGQHSSEVLAPLPPGTPPTAVPSPDERPLLAGLKVLDMGAYHAGPYASRLLADLGADVVKLETLGGDPLRGLDRPYFSASAGKRSISVNLKDGEGHRIGAGLAAWADVIHHNLRPGVAERLGLGYQQVRAFNEGVVYLEAPGWGTSGPEAGRQSFAPKMSGYVGVNFEVAGEFNPPLFPVGNEDPGEGLLGAFGMLLALVHRQRTGQGQHVETPQLHAAMAHLAHIVRRADGAVLGAGRLDPLQFGTGPLCRLYQTADGWICLATPDDDDHIARLGKALGVDMVGDPRFATAAARSEHPYALADVLADAFAGQPTADVRRDLDDAGVPAAVPVPQNSERFLRDPENHRSRRAAEVAHPTKGKVREPDQLLRATYAAIAPHRAAPAIGGQTDEVLAMLGYGEDQIAALRNDGVVR